MIFYNGVSISDVAPVQIEDIRVSGIQYNPVTRPRAVRFGSEFVRMGGGVRTVTLSFALLERNAVLRQGWLRALSEWARTDAEYKMMLPTDPDRCLYCVCTSKPEPSTRAWYENKLKLVFTCVSNPYWTDTGETGAATGVQFNIRGDAPPLMRIITTRQAAASNQSYSDGTNTMTFTTIPAGDMVIDLNNQTATVGGASIMNYYTPSSRFIIPRQGFQTFTGDGTIRFRERWE